MPLLVETMGAASQALETRLNATSAVCNLVVHRPASRGAAVRLDALPALKTLARAASTDDHARTLAKILRDLTWDVASRPVLVQQGAMALCARFAKKEPADLKHDVATATCNLCACGAEPELLVEEGAVGALFWLTLQDLLSANAAVFGECATALRYLAQHPRVVPLLCDETNLLPLITRLARFDESEAVRYDAAVVLYHALSHEPSQRALCRAGAVKILTDLAATGPRTREVCSAALHQLPNDLMSHIDGQLLGVLMS